MIAVLNIIFGISSFVKAEESNYKKLNISNDDITLISKTVRAESKGYSYLTKACVTAMILNRLQREDLSDDVEETVFEKGAFLIADKTSISETVSEEELSEYIVLTKLIYEYNIDPTCGAVFCFYENDPDISDFNVTISIEGLVFAKP